MFNEKHPSSTENGMLLAFLKSLNVQAYPCGNRRSTLIETDSVDNSYYIPFDPEAKLNTEANTKKMSGLNGYTQTFLNKWDENLCELSLVIAGYYFNIKLATGWESPNTFATKLLEVLSSKNSSSDAIYANIRIEETPLFSSTDLAYSTSILAGQASVDSNNLGSIDMLRSPAENETNVDEKDVENYYFSGISFSTSPLSSNYSDPELFFVGDKLHQQTISLKLLQKVDDVWQINQSALLPKIEHGDTEDSVKINNLEVNNINATTITTQKITQDGKDVPIIALERKDNSWQLQITNVMKVDSNN
jgi:hypothetical protein